MNVRTHTGLALGLGLLAACGGGRDSGDLTGPDLAVQPGEAFTLEVGKTAQLEGADLTVRLVEVANDSRCPVDVVCVWAGDAIAAIEVVTGGVERAFGLHANPGQSTGPGTVSVGGYAIALEAVEPQPHADVPVSQTDYRVTLRIRTEGLSSH
jgi:hypothetical protein